LLVAVPLAAAAALLYFALTDNNNATAFRYASFTSAVVLGAFYGSWATGVATALLAALLTLYWVHPGPFTRHDWFGFAVFLFNSLLIVGLAALLHRTARRLRDENTERRRAEEQNALAVRHWQETFDAARDAVWVVDSDLRIVRSNRAAQALFAHTAAAMQGRYCWEIAFGSLQPRPDCPLSRAARSLQRETIELPLDTRWFEVSVDPILDADGHFSGAVQTVADITARRLAEEERALLGNTIGGSLNEIYIFDAATLRFRYGNAGALGNLGYTLDQLRTLTPLDLAPEYNAATFASLLEPMRHGDKPSVVIETLHRRADGSTYPVEVHLQLLLHEGRPVFLAILSDITRRRQLEQELRNAQADLERLVRARTAALESANALLDQTGQLARVGGWEYDLRTATVNWTLAVRLIHEVDDTYHPMPVSLVDFYEPEARPAVVAALQALRTDGSPFDLELPFVSARGTPLWVRTTGQAYREDGVIVRLGGVVQDITARRRAEDELRQQRDQLEQLLAERTAANTRLRELDRLKSEFLSTMSHELRTPLNSIVGFTGILLKGLAGPLNPEQHKQLALVQSSARHLLALINDLLDLSRIESGRIELQREPFDFAEVVAEVAAFLQPVVAQKPVALRHECAPPALPLVGDRRRSLQVLLNLATNAVKFTEHGEVALAARLEAGRLVVTVRDTGIGIRPDQMTHLFEAFRQLDATARRHYEGTGLGLHLSKKLLDLLGGTIAVESAPGAGSTFTFTLPLSPP
jgi:PAS domain S-box-containing protein